MPPRPMSQTELFQDAESPVMPRLPQGVQIELLLLSLSLIRISPAVLYRIR